MNIIIPLGGKGERFINSGYKEPKPLIKILNKEMIFYLLDNLNLLNEDKIFIIYNIELENFNFETIIKKKYNQINFIKLNYQTSGATETIKLGINTIKNISNYTKCVVLDCDTFYTHDILSGIRNINENMICYTKRCDEPPIYSYLELDTHNNVLNIQEKIKISSCANTGCYVFNDINTLYKYCNYVLDNNIKFKNEAYTSCVISEMLKDKIIFKGHEINEQYVFSLGTPNEVNNFINRSYVFLFDLDGTLVNTDNIYFNVWKKILNDYNIHLTLDIFNKYIHGNSDDKVVKTLISNDTDVTKISTQKDNLFIEDINNINIIDGMFDFIKLIRLNGYPCSIVTNCNRMVAEKIIEKCSLTNLIDFIVIGNECEHSKPYPDPYLKAMNQYNIQTNKVFIFEDSKSGLLSARLSNPFCIIGIYTNYSKEELIDNGAHIIIDNYLHLDLIELLSYNKIHNMEQIKLYIKQSLNINIKNIIIDDIKLKGGYISDVISLQIVKNDDSVLNCVLKLENNTETNLSLMAKKLNLYERENYFYDTISKYVNINIPHFFGLIKDTDFNTIGILMENLNTTGNYTLNLNLNKSNINISLKLVEELSKLHIKFWNKNIKNLFPELKKHNDKLFNPTWKQFIEERIILFKSTWKNILNKKDLDLIDDITKNFDIIQERLSNNNLTLIHGDVKSPNIFYNNNNFEPIFLDWQYVAIGKGVQDLIFFIIESYDLEYIKIIFPILKNYYYIKIIENNINYSYLDYENDIKDSVSYFPFFVAIWFGTTPQDELIDKNFPFFFIQKLFYFLNYI